MPMADCTAGVRMPGRAIVAALLLAMVGLSGCSRLSFVKPDVSRGGPEYVKPEVSMSPDSYDKGTAAARVKVSEAQQSLRAGDYPGAAAATKEALRLAPKSAPAHTLAALIAEHNGDDRKAGEHYRKALDLAPLQGGMHNNYGTWLCTSGRAEESLQWFDQALADPAYPTPAVALANAGACAQTAGQTAQAERYLELALELDPQNPVALGAMAEQKFRTGDAFRARAFSQRRLAAAPADAGALLLASQIEQKLGDRDAAAAYVQRLRAEFPGTAESGSGVDGK